MPVGRIGESVTLFAVLQQSDTINGRENEQAVV